MANNDERRRADRHRLCLPTRIDTATSPERFGMTRNVSTTGLLLSTPSRLRIGERAILSFKLGKDGPAYTGLEARIVRLELNHADEVGIWRYLCAVRFATPIPESEITSATTEA